MAVLKFYKDGEWQKINAPSNEVTADSIGAIPSPDSVQEDQILTYKNLHICMYINLLSNCIFHE